MAQFYEVVSDANVDQTHQFFNVNQDNEPNERAQVEYIHIAAENSPHFQTQQLLLQGDQVMVLDGTQQHIQRVVIDPGHAFATSSQQFGTIVQSSPMNSHPSPQIYLVEAGSSDSVQRLQTVQTSQVQTQPIVLNHQMSATNTNPGTRQGPQAQRLQLRTPARQGIAQQTRPLSLITRQVVPQVVRAQQQPSPVRIMTPQQAQMRVRTASSQIKLQTLQQQQQMQQHVRHPQLNQHVKEQITQHAKAQLVAMGRQNLQKQQQQVQQRQQMAQQPQEVAQQPQQVAQQPQQVAQQPQQVVQQQMVGQQPAQQQPLSQFQKELSNYQQRQQQKVKTQEAELDDHDPAMNSTPSGQIATYKKLLEHRPIAKNTLLSRLSSNIKVTQAAQHQHQAQTIEQVVNQINQQQQQPTVQQQHQTVQQQHQIVQTSAPESPQPNLLGIVMKRARPAARPKNPTAVVRGPPGGTPRPAPRVNLRPPTVQRQYNNGNNARMVVPPQPPAGPRFAINQQQHQLQQIFENQQQQLQQRSQFNTPPQQAAPVQQQPPPAPHQSQQQSLPIQQNGVSSTVNLQPRNVQQQPRNNQSQMNYVITPFASNRQPQRNAQSNLSQAQLQQIISMFKDNSENRPVAAPEDMNDSIRMLVLLENGEQRLITFTLPKEACTIQEILEEVNVPFTAETNIQVTEFNIFNLNYVVTVGNISSIGYGLSNEEEQAQEATVAEAEAEQQETPGKAQYQQQLPLLATAPQPDPPPKPPTPEPPKLIPGKLAVCFICGYTGEDFNKCSRCSRKLPEKVRSVDANTKMDLIKGEILKQPQIKLNLNSSVQKQDIAVRTAALVKKKIVKPKAVESESVVISSDEEEDHKRPTRLVSEQLLHKLGSSISISPITKEPSLSEIKKHVRKLVGVDEVKPCRVSIKCRTIRIGSYRFEAKHSVILDSKCIIIKAPVRDSEEIKTIRIDRGDIVKVLVCFHKSLPLMFYYLNVGAAPIITDLLNLTKDSGYFFDPVEDKEDSYRKITFLSDDITEELKPTLQMLYSLAPASIIDELSLKEANDILVKTCPKDALSKYESHNSEMKQLFMYPKEGTNRLSITIEDYVCLAADQFLNDKIIDFYLTYLWENLPQEQQKKVHVFSTFFYKRLTSKVMKVAKKANPNETETLTAAEKRHARVKNWTKKINIFEKDFIVLPINESAHWFLAIICFPGLKGAETFDGKPYVPPLPKKYNKKKKVCYKNQKIAEEVKKEKPIVCDEPLSDKDEAESEDSDMQESDDSEESIAATAIAAAAVAAPPAPTALPPGKSKPPPKVPIKQPCILIFDSLAGPSRNRVIATLRDYLTCEYKTKMETERVYNKDVIKGSCCKVPQQNNFTDCGLYVLQYVEQFFKDPITDYNTPIKEIKNWFEEIVVTKKREDICNLVKDLMAENETDTKMLPEIALPTLNGKLIERPELDHNQENSEEQEDMFTDIEDSDLVADTSVASADQSGALEDPEAEAEEDGHDEMSSSEEQSSYENSWPSPVKPSDSSVEEKSGIVETVVQSGSLRPTLSEFPKQTSNKATLNYLKSIRIDRHKASSDEPDFKKTRLD